MPRGHQDTPNEHHFDLKYAFIQHTLHFPACTTIFVSLDKEATFKPMCVCLSVSRIKCPAITTTMLDMKTSTQTTEKPNVKSS